MSGVSELYRSRELVLTLTRRELSSKYRVTALGHVWSLANPLAMMLVYTLVFSFIMRVQPDPGDPSGVDIYALFLLCGLLPWLFFTGVVNGGIGALIGNGVLIKKVAFPRTALVTSASLALLCTFGIEIAVLVVVLAVVNPAALMWAPLAAVFIIVLWAFAVGVAMMLAIANVYFRDTQHLVVILLQVWFFLTPVIYPISLVRQQSEALGHVLGPITLLDLYSLNPMCQFVTVFRNILYDNRLPDLSSALACVMIAAIVFGAGIWVFKRYESRLAEVL